jgi:hypothetical protein
MVFRPGFKPIIFQMYFFLICIAGGGIELVPIGTAATSRPTLPTPVPLCPPQTPHARMRTRAAAVGNLQNVIQERYH